MTQFKSTTGAALAQSPELLSENFAHAFPRRMALVTAGTADHYNTMTIGWGLVGFAWGKPLVEVQVRPSRYTHDFMESQQLFTVSFFAPDKKEALMLCGSKSGRDIDKAAEAGLTPLPVQGSVAFEEATSIYLCKKMFQVELTAGNFLDKQAEQQYFAEGDYHTVYYGELLELLERA